MVRISLLVIFNFLPQINHFYYFMTLHGLQDVENHCTHLRDIELKTKFPYLRVLSRARAQLLHMLNISALVLHGENI